jgi:ABC-type glycerol-3-phosphate transport system substrate-binding protein
VKTKFRAGLAALGAVALLAAGCGDDTEDSASGGDLIKVGFAQTGSESGWRSANTESMKEAFSKENGFDLVFNAADNDPATRPPRSARSAASSARAWTRS